MKVDYGSILESYDRVYRSLNMSIALEATDPTPPGATPGGNTGGNNTPPTNTAAAAKAENSKIDNKATDMTNDNNQLQPSEKMKRSILQKIQDFIQKISNMVQEASVKIANRVKLLVMSDKAFLNTLHQKRASNKPLNAFKAITYTYDPRYLENVMDQATKISLGAINQLTSSNTAITDPKVKSVVECSPDATTSVLLSQFVNNNAKHDANIDIHTFSREMIDTFRGKKEEKVWNQSHIPTLIQIAQGSTKMGAKYNEVINRCKNSINSLKQLQVQARTQKSTEQLKEITQRVNKCMAIYNALVTINRMYFELKTEEILSARELLKKFYQF